MQSSAMEMRQASPAEIERKRLSLISGLSRLLQNSPDQDEEMNAVSSLLSENDLLDGQPNLSSPQTFADSVFPESQMGQTLARYAINFNVDPSKAESPEDLILRLLPSDGHLD